MQNTNSINLNTPESIDWNSVNTDQGFNVLLPETENNPYLDEAVTFQKKFFKEKDDATLFIDPNWKPSYAQEKKAEYEKKVLEKHMKEAQKLIEGFVTKKRDLSQQINKLKYPLYTTVSTLNYEKQMGISESIEAKIWLSSPKTENQIIRELEDAIVRERNDYLSTLVNNLLNTETVSEKTLGLKSKILAVVKPYYMARGIDKLELEKAQIDSAIKKMEKIIALMPYNKPKNFAEWERLNGLIQPLK